MTRSVLTVSLLFLLTALVFAGEPFDGYTLISPKPVSETSLLDMDGVTVKIRHGADSSTSMAYMLADSSILRPCADRGGEFGVGGATVTATVPPTITPQLQRSSLRWMNSGITPSDPLNPLGPRHLSGLMVIPVNSTAARRKGRQAHRTLLNAYPIIWRLSS
jgi:hypothetical protein